MTGRPPHLSSFRLLAGVVVPFVAYLIIRVLTGSSVGAVVMIQYLRSQKLVSGPYGQ